MHQMISDDSVETRDHTLDVYTEQFQCGDFRTVGAHRDLPDQTGLQKQINMDAACRRPPVELVFAMF